MPKLRDKEKPAPNPGAFRTDGSYFPAGDMKHRGPTDHFVRAMVKSRIGPGFHPTLASEAITLAKQVLAFPNWRQWAEATGWAATWTSTSAEEAVKRCGLGISGHWCGELWAEGPESACSEPGHRQEQDLERVRSLVSGLVRGMSDTVLDRRDQVAASVPESSTLKPADETWRGWKP